MNILQALSDPKTLGASIKNPESWKSWTSLLTAIFGLPLTGTALDLYRPCSGRVAPPAAPFQFVWLCIGRRGGKSFAMAVLAVFLGLFKDWRRFLSPGERAVILLVAADTAQAKILFKYIVGLLKPKLLAAEVERMTASEIELKNAVTIEVCACSYRSVRGAQRRGRPV